MSNDILHVIAAAHAHFISRIETKTQNGEEGGPHSHHKFRVAAFLQQAKKKLTDEEVHHYIISMFGKFMKMRR